MRTEFLWDFAHVLHIPAPAVDALRFLDFCHYLVGIKSYREAKKKEAAAQHG